MFSEQKKIPIRRFCNRSGPDRSVSLRATHWYFSAALNSLITLWFMWVDDRMTWQVSFKLVSGFVQFNLWDFADIISFDVSVNDLLKTLS